ncbi:hypothetical protein GJ26_18980, partial [Vibrio cholerae]
NLPSSALGSKDLLQELKMCSSREAQVQQTRRHGLNLPSSALGSKDLLQELKMCSSREAQVQQTRRH